MKSIEINPKNKEDFYKILEDDIPCITLFRMNMCPHCVAMKDSWEQVKQSLLRHPGIHVAEVEYQHMNLLPQHLQNIRGFPTIQILEKRRVKNEYVGDRSFESILDFALQNAAEEKQMVKKVTKPQLRSKPKAKPKVKNPTTKKKKDVASK